MALARFHRHSWRPPTRTFRVYPTTVKPSNQRKGVIPMSVSQFVTLAIVFIVLAWAGSAALAYGVVQATAGGPEGPQGIQGIEGSIGPEGPEGPPGDDAAQEMVKRMAGLWAVQQASGIRGGAFVEHDGQSGDGRLPGVY